MSEKADRTSLDAGPVEAFAAHCAHDFNNLLTGVLGNLELMQNRARRAGVHDFDAYMEGARNAAGRAADFSQRLLAYSGRAMQPPEMVQVNPLVVDLVELMREQAFAVQAATVDEAGAVFCCPEALESALRELLSNARDAIAGGGEVRIITAQQNDQMVICVVDNGPGMDTEQLKNARAPFFTSKANGAGKGLGLAIVDRFARQFGGFLELESTPGQGTTARLVLPQLTTDN